MGVMTLGLIGKKLGMTQIFDKDGVLVPVTLIEAGPCPVLQKKDKSQNGYCAIQLGFDKKPNRRVIKPEMGLFTKMKLSPVRIIREFRVEDPSGYQIGQMIGVDIFEEGERVDVTGLSKGRGFAGTVKRLHTQRGPESHGSKYHRRVGSLSASSDPSRVLKGKPMPGHMGNQRRTIVNLKVVGMQKEKNILMIKGSVPGYNNGYVLIRKAKKNALKDARR